MNPAEAVKVEAEPASPSKWLLPALILCVAVIWWLGYLLARSVSTEWAVRGQFGDMFGAVNALFSALAFAGVLYAIRLQSAELALQRQELKDSRTELQRTASAQEASARLNALNALVEHYRVASLATDTAGIVFRDENVKKRNALLARLEKELASLSQDGNGA